SGLYYILGSINYTNHESSTDFVTVTLPLSAYAGREINIKFFAVQGSGNWFFVLDDVAVSGQPPAPEIVIDPLSFDFGSLDVGLDSPNAPFTITNIGNSPLHISSIEIEGPDLSEYDIILPDDLPWVIDHDTPKVFYVTFAPLSVGTKSASVVITHNASETPVAIPLAGEGLFVAEEDSVELPKTTHLGNNYPNPFNPETTISFSLVKESYILLDIYNIKGQKVYTLVDNELSAGHHNIVWYGIDQNGNAQSSGVYFYRMKTAEYQAVKKMILMK
ncbi:MAG: choice-of-anchor D domain-containing protein, partial [Candidatus Cloacimonetes bacterium]|nr:choice-of-anchor D domain-containing protein [Candidatus Cloacimonadota bacterium]